MEDGLSWVADWWSVNVTKLSTFADFIATLNETSFDDDHQNVWDSCKEIYYLVVYDPNNAFRTEPVTAELTIVENSTGKRLIDALVPSKEKTVVKLYLCYYSFYLLTVTPDCSQFYKDYTWQLIRESTGATINYGGDDTLGCDLFSTASTNRTNTSKCRQGGLRRSVCKNHPNRRLEEEAAEEAEDDDNVAEYASALSLQPTSIPTFADSTLDGAPHYFYYGDFNEDTRYLPIRIPSMQPTSTPGPSAHPVSNRFPYLDQTKSPLSTLPTSKPITLAETIPIPSALLTHVPFGDTDHTTNSPSHQPMPSQPNIQISSEATRPSGPLRDDDRDENMQDQVPDSDKAARPTLPMSMSPPPTNMNPTTPEPSLKTPIFYPTTSASSSRAAAFDNIFNADLRYVAHNAHFDNNIDICRPTSVGDSTCDAVNNNAACGETNHNLSLEAGVFRLGRW